MTDPDETANLVEEITEAYRAHAAEEAAAPADVPGGSDGNIVDQIDRYRELDNHDLTARSIATLKARGEWTEERARCSTRTSTRR